MTHKPTLKDIAGMTGRIAAGGVFLYAGFLKAIAPAEEFAFAIETYKVVSPAIAYLTALTIPWLEIYLGVFLIAGLFTEFSALGIIAMLAGFEGLLLQAILRKLPVTSCGCFGSGKSNSLGYEFSQNIVFLLLAFLAFKYGSRFSLDSLLSAQKPVTSTEQPQNLK